MKEYRFKRTCQARNVGSMSAVDAYIAYCVESASVGKVLSDEAFDKACTLISEARTFYAFPIEELVERFDYVFSTTTGSVDDITVEMLIEGL